MTSIDEFFGNYLKTEDIKEEITHEILKAEAEEIGREQTKEKKIVVYFKGVEKGLALNKINAEAFADITGSREIETWPGKRVTLYIDPNVMFGGKRVGGIRIKVPVDETVNASVNNVQ